MKKFSHIISRFFLLMVAGSSWRDGLDQKYRTEKMYWKGHLLNWLIGISLGIILYFILMVFGIYVFAVCATVVGVSSMLGSLWALRKYKK